MLNANKLTETFYLINEFSKGFECNVSNYHLSEDNSRKRRNKPNCISDSKVMTILIAFHLSGMRNLKH